MVKEPRLKEGLVGAPTVPADDDRISAPRPPVSVVICARNEADRLGACLEHVLRLGAGEIVLVDGGSEDGTISVAEAFPEVRIVRSGGRGLAYDRQLGASLARHGLVAMIDADHRPGADLLDALLRDLEAFDFCVVQAGVEIEPTSFWTAAEAEAMATFHHQPGPRTMIGVSPALFKKEVLEKVPFDTENREVSDDADFCYRLTQLPGARFGVGRCKVPQEHRPSLEDYRKKFRWYGRMDAAFCAKHPQRTANMLFHLLVRYPILRPLRALAGGRFRAPFWFWLAAALRFRAFLGYFWEAWTGRRSDEEVTS